MPRKSNKRGGSSRAVGRHPNRSKTNASMAEPKRSTLRYIGAPTFVNGGMLLPGDVITQASEHTAIAVEELGTLDTAKVLPNEEATVLDTMELGMSRSLEAASIQQDSPDTLEEDEILFRGKDPQARMTALVDEDQKGWHLPQQDRHEASSPKLNSNGNQDMEVQPTTFTDNQIVVPKTTSSTFVEDLNLRHTEDQTVVSSQIESALHEMTDSPVASISVSLSDRHDDVLHANTVDKNVANQLLTEPQQTSQATPTKRKKKNQARKSGKETPKNKYASSKAPEDYNIDTAYSSDEDDDEAILQDYVQNMLEDAESSGLNDLLRFANRDIGLGHDLGTNADILKSSRMVRSESLSPIHDVPQRPNKDPSPDSVEVSSEDDELEMSIRDWAGAVESAESFTPPTKRSTKGRLANCPQVSDEELQEKLNAAWTNDRAKKKERKNLREEQRQLGLLKSKGKHSRSMSEDSDSDSADERDLKVKYPLGLTKQELWREISMFCKSTKTELALPPLDTHARKLLHTMSSQLKIKSKSRGSGSDRFLVLSKPNRRCGFDEAVYERLGRFMKRSWFGRTDVVSNGRNKSSNLGFRAFAGDNGAQARPQERVGEGAAALGQEKGIAKARAMMEKMGWSAGQGLGTKDNEGIVDPIEQMVWYSRAGLG